MFNHTGKESHENIYITYKTFTRNIKTKKDRERLGRNWLEQVKAKCPEVKFISHYALLGRYDFLDIYEAPDEETAAKVSMISLSEGAFQSESLFAIPYKRFLELTEEIK